MFDLFRSSQKGKKILLSVVLGIVALSMLLYLIPGAGTSTGSGSNDQIVAEIGTDSVTVRQVEQGIRNVIQGRQVSPDVISAIVPQLVEQTITDRALAYEAKRLGFQVSDFQLATTIRSTPQVASIRLRSSIRCSSSSNTVDRSGIRRQSPAGSSVQNIMKIAMEGAFVSPAEVEAEYRRRNEMAKLEYIAFDPAKLGEAAKPTTEELKAYFEKNKAFFPAPESRRLQLIVADQVKVGESIQIPDSQIQSYYNSNKDQYRTKERVKARHILISILNKPGRDPKAQGQGRGSFEADQSRGGLRQAGRAEFRRQDQRGQGGRSGLGDARPDGSGI